MKILIGCEFSQVVTLAFRNKGHDAYSCDILPTEGNQDWHIKDDVLNHLKDGWDLAIFHPPCTHLACSGARWFKDKQQECRPCGMNGHANKGWIKGKNACRNNESRRNTLMKIC